jgi:hypothetical protein
MTKRDWTYLLLPLLQCRAYPRQVLLPHSPKGVHRREWTGIRPTQKAVIGISPIELNSVTLHGSRWLVLDNSFIMVSSPFSPRPSERQRGRGGVNGRVTSDRWVLFCLLCDD